MLNTQKLLILIGFVGFVALLACKKEKANQVIANCPTTISYNTAIKPIIEQNCSTSGCHDNTASGGYNLTSHAQVSNNATIILKTIRHEGGVQAMPQGGAKLPTTSADNFDCWIQQGKLDN